MASSVIGTEYPSKNVPLQFDPTFVPFTLYVPPLPGSIKDAVFTLRLNCLGISARYVPSTETVMFNGLFGDVPPSAKVQY